jgi:methylated-DNA-[protein]-cysteine S-methyltransferase
LSVLPRKFFRDSLESSPLGRIDLECSEAGMTRIQFFGFGKPSESCEFAHGHSILTEAMGQIVSYLDGSLRKFDLLIDLTAISPFARAIREICLKIPYATTVTYSQLAEQAGHAGKARAVGKVNARNPLPLVIPCHRVVGKDGGLRGYLGPGGVKTKAWLLEMEARKASDA